MNTGKIDPRKNGATPDDLVSSGKSGNVELSKEELDSVSGGAPLLTDEPIKTPSPSGPVPIPYPNLGSKP